jgi:hypothetical protein
LRRLFRMWVLCLVIDNFAQVPPGATSGNEPQRTRQAAQPVREPMNPQPSPQMSMRDPFAGSITSGPATPGVLSLSLTDAIARGLKFNLGLILGEQETQVARAARLRALSALLPNLNAAISETSQQ